MVRQPRESLLWSEAHGPLPGLLLLMTVATGAIDAVSILRLGRVFVANMTGNVVFAGFALAGAPGFALGSSLVALAGFLVGAASGGWLTTRFKADRAHLLLSASVIETVLVAVVLAVAASGASLTASGGRYTASALLALAMGIQNAAARSLAVPDLTTTVLTMTLTGMGADLRRGRWRQVQMRRRFLAVLAMVGGAIAGAELVLHPGPTSALALVTGLLAAVAVGTGAVLRLHGPAGGQEWRRPPGPKAP